MELTSTQLKVCEYQAWRWASTYSLPYDDVYQEALIIGLENARFKGKAFNQAIHWGLIGKFRKEWRLVNGDRVRVYSLDALSNEHEERLSEILAVEAKEEDEDVLTYVDDGKLYSIDREDWLRLIQEELAVSSEKERKSILEHFWEGRSFTDMAKESGMSKQNENLISFRFRQRLKERLRRWRSKQSRSS